MHVHGPLALGWLLRDSNPKEAISLYQEDLDIDPMRLGVHAATAETYVTMAGQATDQIPRSLPTGRYRIRCGTRFVACDPVANSGDR